MKQIIPNYSFNKDAKTITMTDFASVGISRLMLVTNITANTIIYQFNNPALGGTAAGNVITLAHDTSAMSNTDALQIIYNTAAGDPAYDAPLLDSNSNVSTTLATAIAGEDLSNDVVKTKSRSSYANISASTLIATGPGRIFGIFVASASNTPTIKIWDNTSAATTTLINTFTPAAAAYYQLPGVEFATGLYVTIGGTVDCTVFYK